jgi:hypothetical protein
MGVPNFSHPVSERTPSAFNTAALCVLQALDYQHIHFV